VPKGICVLCGEKEATTSDHIPPLGLYPKPRDHDINFHTVPACIECNRGTSKEDEEFKVGMCLGTSLNRGEDGRLIDWVAGTIAHNKRLGHHVLDNSQLVRMTDGDGTHQDYVKITFPSDAYEVVAKKIIKGLYWRETGKILSKQANIWIRPVAALDKSTLDSFITLLRVQEEQTLNKDTFSYRCELSNEKQSFWGCSFFGAHSFFALVTAE